MTNNQSSISFKKEDGKPITFNFQLENGLPYKTIICPKFKVVKSNKTKEFGIYSYLNSEEIEILKNININSYLCNLEEVWLISDNYYVVFENLNDTIIEELKNKNLGFCFFNLNKEFIKGIKFE